MKIAKWVSITLIAVFLLFVLSLEVLYRTKLSDIKTVLHPSNKVYPEDVINTEWVDAGGHGEVAMVSLSPLGFVWSFYRTVTIYPTSHEKTHYTKSMGITSRAARTLLSLQNQKIRIIDWHFANAVASIWISKHWTAAQAVSTTLTHSYYGFQNRNFEQAAQFYFDKTIADLSLNDIVTLTVIRQAPSRKNPFCHKERLTMAAAILQAKLNKNWPSKYGHYVYSLPLTKQPTGLTCE